MSIVQTKDEGVKGEANSAAKKNELCPQNTQNNAESFLNQKHISFAATPSNNPTRHVDAYSLLLMASNTAGKAR